MINSYINSIDELKKIISEYPLEITEGTKKMIEDYGKKACDKLSVFISELIPLYENDRKEMIEVLLNRKNNYLPKCQSEEISLLTNKLNLLNKVLIYTNEYNDTYDKSDFCEAICNIDDINNNDLKEVNDILLTAVNKFKKAGIKISEKDFNYTMYTYKYMKSFFENVEQKDFNDIMEQLFDDIYWKSPKLLTQLKLNLLTLVNKYAKQIGAFCNQRKLNLYNSSETDEQTCLDTYNKCREELSDAIDKDVYLNMMHFVNKESNISDYLISSPIRNQKMIRFIKDDDFNNYSVEEREKFYQNVISLKSCIYEMECYRLYEPILKDLLSRFNDKEKNKGTYLSKQKDIKKFEKDRVKTLKKFLSLNRYNKEKYRDKLNMLSNKINEDISMLEKLYDDLEDLRVNEKLYVYLNNGSTIHDALSFATSFYSYLKNIIIKEYNIKDNKQIEDMISKLNDFVNNPNNIIIKKTNFLAEFDLEYLLINRCKLLNINVEKEDIVNDLDGLKTDMDFISRIYNVDRSETTLEKINFVCAVENIQE